MPAAISIVLALTLLLQTAPQVPPPLGLASGIEATVQRWRVPGVAVAVVKDGRVVLTQGYGVKKAGEADRVEDSTTFYTASVTKTFTVTALGMLADEGQLRIDDPMQKYMPAFAVADADTSRLATVRDLMAHRTGLPRADLLLVSDLAPPAVLTRLRGLPSIAPLRSRFTYQNQMYLALGELVGQLGHTTWASFVETRILAKLGMADSNAAGLGRGTASAWPHAMVDGRVAPVDLQPRFPTGAGGVNSSARDLARWLQFQMGDGTWQGAKLVNPQVLSVPQQPNAITAPTLWTPGANFLLYGLGWFLSDYQGRKIVQHAGNGEGWTSLVWMMPGEHLGVAVVTNMHNTLLPWAIAHQVADAYTGGSGRDWPAHFLDAERSRDLAQARQTRAPGTGSVDPAPWAGEWRHPVFGSLTVEMSGGHLTLRYGNNVTAEVRSGATPSDAVALWTRSDLVAAAGPAAMKRSARGADDVLSLTFGGDTIDFVRVK